MKTIVLLLLFPLSLQAQGEIREMTPSEYTYCQLIEKPFMLKNGEISTRNELYLRCSVQDYFIKLCESQVTREDLLPFLDKGIAVKMTTVEGNWDICPEDPEYMQSRTGRYVTIEEIKTSANALSGEK